MEDTSEPFLSLLGTMLVTLCTAMVARSIVNSFSHTAHHRLSRYAWLASHPLAMFCVVWVAVYNMEFIGPCSRSNYVWKRLQFTEIRVYVLCVDRRGANRVPRHTSATAYVQTVATLKSMKSATTAEALKHTHQPHHPELRPMPQHFAPATTSSGYALCVPLYIHGTVYVSVNALLVCINACTLFVPPWCVFVIGGWGVGMAVHMLVTHVALRCRSESLATYLIP
eukprot:NODE_4621_length_762_cov_28.148031_g4462_i0.p1 GENE.NODE_4621_length_762_cov_28.148031_g4462_i0~~NODE_4621_length_762_cov_28.148031_g4462_i0.p1  ORF type:complete len:242 (-),score=28.29 NODE_4621_length_762_cov_28.148031_g4462_i0:36-710(-)